MFTGEEDGLQFAIRVVQDVRQIPTNSHLTTRRRGQSPKSQGFEEARRLILTALKDEQKRRLDAEVD